MNNYVLAIDIGTTSAKALAVQADGQIVSSLQKFYTTHYPQPGFAEQDPELIFQSVNQLVEETLATLPNKSLLAIALSCAMHGVMAVDVSGNPLTPLVIWSDTRSKAQAFRLRSGEPGKKIYERTGTPIHPMSPLCKLLWWKETNPELFRSTHKFVSVKEFILWKWTGHWIVDYSIASATGYFDIRKKDWSEEALEELSVSKEKFSSIVSPDHAIPFQKSWTDKNPRLQAVSIIVGSSDGCLAQLGSGALANGMMTITLGTSGAVRIARKDYTVDPGHRTFCYRFNDEWLVCGGATNNGTALIDWFANQFGVNGTLNLFAEHALRVDAEGLIALPYWQGERAPIYQPDAKGVFFGITQRHTSQHFQRAILEGICFELRSILESVEDVFGPSAQLLVSGGIIRSDHWLQLLSSILDKPLLVNAEYDASALGAAQLGYASLGIDYTPTTNVTKVFKPEAKQIYQERYALFQKLNKQLLPMFNSELI